MLGLRRIAVLGAASGRRAASAAAAAAPAAAAKPATSGAVNLAQLETRWPSLSDADRRAARDAVKQLMRGDWKALSAEQKHAGAFMPIEQGQKAGLGRRSANGTVELFWAFCRSACVHAAYFVAYGPTVPKPSDTYLVAGSVAAAISVGVGLFAFSRALGTHRAPNAAHFKLRGALALTPPFALR